MDENKAKGMRIRMREAVRKAGYTVESFCEIHGISRYTLYDYTAYPTAYMLLLISNECHVTTDYILKGE